MAHDNILRNSDDLDSVASPIATHHLRRRAISRVSAEERTNSLNTSTVEQEGKIDSSPKKNHLNQLIASKHQNPFEVKQDQSAFASQPSGQKVISKRNIKIIKKDDSMISPLKAMRPGTSEVAKNSVQKILQFNQEFRNGPKQVFQGNISPAEEIAGKPLNQTVETGKMIIRSRIQSTKRMPSNGGGLKIKKLKGHVHKNSGGYEGNSIDYFTKEADI